MKSDGNLENVKNEVANKYNNDIETSQLHQFLENAHVEYKEDSQEEGNYNAVLTPGIWFYGESKDICISTENKKVCPCKISSNESAMWSGPCFQELTKDDIKPKNQSKQPQQPNAFRVKLQIPNASIYIYDFISKEKQKMYLNDAAHVGIYKILSSKDMGSAETLISNALMKNEKTFKSLQIEIRNSGGVVTLKISAKYNGIFLKSGFSNSNITLVKELSI